MAEKSKFSKAVTFPQREVFCFCFFLSPHPSSSEHVEKVNLEAQEIVPIVCIQTNRAANNRERFSRRRLLSFHIPGAGVSSRICPLRDFPGTTFFFLSFFLSLQLCFGLWVSG